MMDLDSTFEQKNEIARAVEKELEKVLGIPFYVCYEFKMGVGHL